MVPAQELSIGPGVGVPLTLIVAEALLKFTVPKLASGSTPVKEEGASSIHSAEDLWGLPRIVWVVV